MIGKKCALGQMNFIPMCYRNKPSMYRDLLDVDVALITVGPMDKHGFFKFRPGRLGNGSHHQEGQEGHRRSQ